MKETKQEAENLLSLTDASVVKLLAEHEEILRLVEQRKTIFRAARQKAA